VRPPVNVVDSHAHLTSQEFDQDRDEVIARARDAGVGIIINPAIDLSDSRKAIELAERHPEIFVAVGIHPHQSAHVSDADLRGIEDLSRHPRVVAIGEIGLDYYYDFSPREEQRRVFREQIGIAVRRDLPIIVHTRDSIGETVQIVEEQTALHATWRQSGRRKHSRYPGARGVYHCFSGDTEMAWRAIENGFYISFPGIITFKNPGLATTVGSAISVEHLLLETDSPYLAPVPHRGSRNEPSRVPLIAQKLSDLQRLSVDDVSRATNYSAHRVFGIGEQPEPEIVYTMRNALYVNLTIRCNADCGFCDRKGDAVIKGHNLRIEHEPSAAEVIAAIGDPQRYEEVVFCGYGEPTIRLEEMKAIARWVKGHGGRTRLNTDGHGNVINGRNIVPELVGLIDAMSISLNSPDPKVYGELMRIDPDIYFAAMIKFARESVRHIPRVVMTIVDLNEVDAGRARRMVEDEIGAVFQRRPFF
jgi:TatD DNase family protein